MVAKPLLYSLAALLSLQGAFALPIDEDQEVVEISKVEENCLNTCYDAVSRFGDSDACSASNPESFYNIAQKCLSCICIDLKHPFPESAELLTGLSECKLSAPTCVSVIPEEELSPEELKKRSFYKKNYKRSYTRKTVYVTLTRPFVPSCFPGYEPIVTTIPGFTAAESTKTQGNSVTIYKEVNFPYKIKTIPPCYKRITFYVTLTAHPSVPTCVTGYGPIVTSIPGFTAAESTTTEGGCVTIFRSVILPAKVATIKPCDNKIKTTTIYRQSYETITCNSGYDAGYVTYPATTYSRTTTTGADGVVTVLPKISWPKFSLWRLACSERVTVTVTPPRPSYHETCIPGSNSKTVYVEGKWYPQDIVTGDDNTVTVSIETSYDGSKTVIPACTTKPVIPTITITPPAPTATETCAPGQNSVTTSIKHTFYPGYTTTGTDGTVTVEILAYYPEKPITLPPCETSVPTVKPTTDPSTEPTGPSTGPSSEPTGPSTGPSSEPTGPSSERTGPSTGPSSEPTGPSTEPTGPSSEPTGPSSEPTGPSSEPSSPGSQTTGPSSEPTGPSSEPTGPSSEPTGPSSEPTGPSTGPSSEPAGPSSEPTGPSSKPTGPSTGPSSEPTGPSSEPTGPSTGPSSEPTGPSSEPTGPSTGPSSEPSSPGSQTTGPSSEPTGPSSEPTGPSTGPSSEPSTTVPPTTAPPSTTTTAPPSSTTSCTKCTCVPKPPVCVEYDVFVAEYCGEQIMYQVCRTYAFIGCAWENFSPETTLARRAAELSPSPSSSAAAVEIPPALTVILSNVAEPVATALADTAHVQSVVHDVLVQEKSKQSAPVKIVDLADIDISLIENAKVVKVLHKEELASN